MSSANSQQLSKHFQSLAASVRAEDHERLRESLASEQILFRLDADEDYDKLRAEQLQLARVLDALAANRSAAAADSLAFLAASTEFTADEVRQEILLRAARSLRPLPEAMLRFLTDQMAYESSNIHLAARTIVQNGTPEAIAIVERAAADPEQEPEDIAGWMHAYFVPHRYDVPLLEASDRLIRSEAVPAEIKIALVESLFDYRPDDWYPADSDLPKPPGVGRASTKARAILRRTGKTALADLDLAAALRSAISRRLNELR